MAQRYVNTGSTAGGDGTTNDTTGAARAYASLSAWEAARQADLVTAADFEVVDCCGATADTTGVTVDGFTTSAAFYVQIRGHATDPAGRHAGVFSTSHYRLDTLATTLTIRDDFIHVDGIQLYQHGVVATDPPNQMCIRFGAGATVASGKYTSLILRGNSLNGCRAVELNTNSTQTTLFANCLVYDHAVTGFDYVFLTAITYLFNNTVHNCGVGIEGDATYVVAKNNVVQDCTTCYTGTFATGTEYNCSDDATQPGANGQNGEVLFVDEAGDNFHLGATDTVARSNGVDLSGHGTYPITTDIDNQTRAVPWDMGIDEIVSTAATPLVGSGATAGHRRNRLAA